MRWLLWLWVVGCQAPGAPASSGTIIIINADGSFSPATLQARSGDTIEWRLHGHDDSVVAGAGCGQAPPWDDPNSFAGPLPVAPSGVWSIGPFGDDNGFVVGQCTNPAAALPFSSDQLCPTGPLGTTMEETWENPSLTGVHLRFLWSDLQPELGRYDTTLFEQEIDRAVAHGKLYSVSVKAGKFGTPDWIFSSDENFMPRSGSGGVTRLRFRDGGDDLAAGDCGSLMDLGSPTEAAYQALWQALLTHLAGVIKARADRYRALAYVKISGANLFSEENRLPNSCNSACPICNTQVWAQSGYTPQKLYAFYRDQVQLLETLFPGKPLSYQLIQAGFPLVSDDGCWLVNDDMTQCPATGTGKLPGGTEQTETILENGAGDPLFVVQHNGLKTAPPPATCPNYLEHPAVGPYAGVSTGCPNHWVLAAGALMPLGQLTAFQTVNASGGVQSPADVDGAFQNLWDDSDGALLEIYEQRLWEASRWEAHGDVQASGRRLADWGAALDQRRSTDLVARTTLEDPNVLVYRHTFSGTGTVRYFHPAKCTTGTIELR